MTIRFLLSLTLLVSSLLPPAIQTHPITTPSPLSPASPWGIQLLSSDDRHAILRLSAPPLEFSIAEADGLPCQLVSAPGYSSLGLAGYPDLPLTGTLLGVPAGAQPTLQVLEAESLTLPGAYDLCPASRPASQNDPAAALETAWTSERSRDAQMFARDAFFPFERARLDSPATIRSQRVVRLAFQPYQYNPHTRQLRYTRQLTVEVRFYPAGFERIPSPGVFIPEGVFETILQNSLSNYQQARAWRVPSLQTTRSSTGSLPTTKALPAYKIQVNQDGIYRLSYTDLALAGLPVDSLDPQTFQVFNQGSEVAIVVAGESDHQFDPTDDLLFYGQKVDTKYTGTNVYWLGFGQAQGLRMAGLPGTPDGSATVPPAYATSLHLEQNLNYQRSDPSGPDNDHWYWDFIYASSAPASAEFTFNLLDLPSSPSVTLSGLLKGYSATPYHHTRIYLNDNLVDEALAWSSRAEYAFQVSLPSSYLLEGLNTIRVECPRDGEITLDVVLVNRFDLHYSQAFLAQNDRLEFTWDQPGAWEFQVDRFSSDQLEIYNLTDPRAPQRILAARTESTPNGYRVDFQQAIEISGRFLLLESGQYLTPLSISLDNPSDLHNISNAADYLVISHADFLASIQPLADGWSSQGLRVQVVDVQDVYDEFNGGVFSPLAIRDFIAHAYANWTSPAPSFVLLVGDGHYDYRNYLGWNETNFIPPFLADADPWVGETAVDNRFVTVSGEDILPDLALGRFPVKTAAETNIMVDNLLAYASNPAPEDSRSLVTFLADNADDAGDFAAMSDASALQLPAHFSIEKIYYLLTHPTPSAVKTSLLSALNQGRLILHYSGHASVQTWANEPLFRLSDLNSLTPTNLQPFLVSYTCTDGYFINPSPPGSNYSSLVESLVRLPAKGVIAGFAPTGFGESAGHLLLDQNFFQAIFQSDLVPLGLAATQAKIATFAGAPGQSYLVDTYVLLGDPALSLPAPSFDIFIPLIQR